MGSRRSGTSRFCQVVRTPQVPIFLPAGPGGGGQASCSGEIFLFTPRRGACPPQDTQWDSVLQAAICHILFVPPLCPVYLLRGVPSRVQGLGGLRAQLGVAVSGGELQLWLSCHHWMLCRSVSAPVEGPRPDPVSLLGSTWVRGWLGP